MKVCFSLGLFLLSANVCAQTPAVILERNNGGTIVQNGAVITQIPAETLLSGRMYNLVLNCAGLNNDLKRVDEVMRKRVPLQITPAEADQPAVPESEAVERSERSLTAEDRQLLQERSHIERLRSEFRCTQ